MDAEALAGLFELFANQVKCVVLNACYSKMQAEAIAQHISSVVGMSKAIKDRAAIEFAVGFYDALGAGKSYEFAYKLGCQAIRMAGIPENLTPQLLKPELESVNSSSKVLWTLELTATIDDVNDQKLKDILDCLREISGDTSLTLRRTEVGSIKLVLEGSKEGMELVKALFESGKLTEVLGIPIQNISQDVDGKHEAELKSLEQDSESPIAQLQTQPAPQSPAMTPQPEPTLGLENQAIVISDEEAMRNVVQNIQRLVGRDKRQDWGGAPDFQNFFGRTNELDTLKQWIVEDRCKLVAILGIGGIGKTGLSIKLGKGGIGKTDLSLKLAQGIQNEFKYVIWRSLLNAPPVTEILADIIKFLSNQQETNLPDTLDKQVLLLLDYLKLHRCLVLLDNAETILQGGACAGQYREGYEGYGQLLWKVGTVDHQSCLLLTSREKPQDLERLAGKTKPAWFKNRLFWVTKQQK